MCGISPPSSTTPDVFRRQRCGGEGSQRSDAVPGIALTVAHSSGFDGPIRDRDRRHRLPRRLGSAQPQGAVILEHGQIVGRLIDKRLTETPKILYGTPLGSHDQAQGLKLSKHFR